MSVELRLAVEGECHCGKPYPTRTEPKGSCVHKLESDWGIVEHTDPRPDRGEIGHLMLTTHAFVDLLLEWGPVIYGPIPRPPFWERRYSATVDQGRIFTHIECNGQRWTWELFDAHWADNGIGAQDIMIGRWPD